jgi:hypothetical protein
VGVFTAALAVGGGGGVSAEATVVALALAVAVAVGVGGAAGTGADEAELRTTTGTVSSVLPCCHHQKPVPRPAMAPSPTATAMSPVRREGLSIELPVTIGFTDEVKGGSGTLLPVRGLLGGPLGRPLLVGVSKARGADREVGSALGSGMPSASPSARTAPVAVPKR